MHKNVRPLKFVQIMRKVHCLRRRWETRDLCVTYIESYWLRPSQHAFHPVVNATFVWKCRSNALYQPAPAAMGHQAVFTLANTNFELQQLGHTFKMMTCTNFLIVEGYLKDYSSWQELLTGQICGNSRRQIVIKSRCWTSSCFLHQNILSEMSPDSYQMDTIVFWDKKCSLLFAQSYWHAMDLALIWERNCTSL